MTVKSISQKFKCKEIDETKNIFYWRNKSKWINK